MNLTCIKCGVEGLIKLHLDDCQTFECGECDEAFTCDEVRGVVSQWAKVLAWVETAPVEAKAEAAAK
jgi:hypothetical protein